MEIVPRDPLVSLPIHDIPNGSYLTDPPDPDNIRLWPEEDGINVLGTPLGTPDFINSYFFGKGIKHRQLLLFIQEVASVGHPREASAMLTWAACPRLAYLLKSMEKNEKAEAWMQEMDSAHVSTWLHGLTSSSSLDHALDSGEKDILSDWLDLLHSYGSADLKSLSRSADEEFLGAFAAIAPSLVSLCMKTNLPIFIRIAEVVEALAHTVDMADGEVQPNLAPMLTTIRSAAERAEVA